MYTYTNEQAQETIALIKGNKPVKCEDILKAAIFVLCSKQIKTPSSRPGRVEALYQSLIGKRFIPREDTRKLMVRLIKRRDWESLNIIFSWAAFPDGSPFNH